MPALLDELLWDATDSEGAQIPPESFEARFIRENYNHIVDAEDSTDEIDIISNARKIVHSAKMKGWTDEARRAAALKRKRKSQVAAERGAGKKKRETVDAHFEPAVIRNGKRMLANGKPLPDYIPKWAPAWTNVKVNLRSKTGLLVTGYDKKGIKQPLYSAEHHMKNGKLKFMKVNELRKKLGKIDSEIAKDLKNPATRENAAVLRLIRHTGLRPGSNKDTKAEVKAYGATTLQARHVSADGKTLRFTGKKGVNLVIKVDNPALAKDLAARKKARGAGENLFDTNYGRFVKYVSGKDGGDFNPKDFRTAKGTEAAIAHIASLKPPTDFKSYKKMVNQVGDHVASLLGNTRKMSLDKYIDPSVFVKWRINQ